VDECVFCDIVDGKAPADVVYSDDEIIAIKDIRPQAPIHILIIPKKHIPTILDIDDYTLVGRMFEVANGLARKLGIAEEGFRLVFNCNRGGGQVIYHLHLHLLGGRQMHWPPG